MSLAQPLSSTQAVTFASERGYDLLWLSVENHHRVVEKEEILTRVWGKCCVEEYNIPVNVARLRRRIGNGRILTVSLRAYQFVAEVLPVDDSAPVHAS